MSDSMDSPIILGSSEPQTIPLKPPPGSRKAPIPIDAPSGFLSAMSLVTKEQLQPDYVPRSLETSDTPSLDDLRYHESAEPAKTEVKGKLKKPTKTTGVASEDATDASTDSAPKKPRKKATLAAVVDKDATDDVVPPPAPKRGRPKKAPAIVDGDGRDPVAAKRSRKKAAIDESDEVQDVAAPGPKKPRKKAVKADTVAKSMEVVDVLSAVENKTATSARPRARKPKAVPEETIANKNAAIGTAAKPVRMRSPDRCVEATATIVPVERDDASQSATTSEKQSSLSRARKASTAVLEVPELGHPTAHMAARSLELDGTNIESERQQSRHFSLPRASRATAHRDDSIELINAMPVFDGEYAPTMRLDWTPPPEDLPPSNQNNSFYEIHDDTPPRDDVSVDIGITGDVPQIVHQHEEERVAVDMMIEEEPSEAINFAALVGNFGYQQSEGEPPVREAGEHASKRRRIEAADAIAKPEKKKREPKKKAAPKEPKAPKAPRKKAEPKPKVPKEPKVPKVKIPKEPKPKKPKAVPKKPLTITALATAAYRQQVVVPPVEEDATKLTSYFLTEVPEADQAEATADAAMMGPPKVTKRKAPAAKTPSKRSKKVEAAAAAALQFKLESPETARQSMRNQDWLFGTSSQLAGADSPTEFRDLQRAIKESEDFVSSQGPESSQAMEAFRAASRLRVPSAPHGTDLSIGQGSRDLWLSAARDHDANMFAGDEGLGILMECEEDEASLTAPLEIGLPVTIGTTSPELPQLLLDKSRTEDDETQDSGYVDIDELPDIVSHDKQPGTMIDQHNEATHQSLQSAPTYVEPLDSFMEADPVPQRGILKTLDPNSSMSKQAIDLEDKLPASPTRHILPPFSQALPPTIDLLSPPKRPIGRPRKTVTGITSSPPKRPVGRPKKTVTDTTITASPKRPVGRPRKGILPLADPIPESLPKETTPRKKKVLTQLPALSSSPYLDIDDISDAEAQESPPSPPRRRRSKSPAVQTTLELSNPAAAPPTKPTSDKQMQSLFSEVSKSLFPKITEVVKAQPPTRDLAKPSWYEKMLLYDPIVLEDLTAWLNGMGVRIEQERVICVAKKKGRKRKSGGDEVSEVTKEKEGEEETKTEIVREELRCWMVQKWCEENSICCLWKEGLRGGVRQKY